MAGNRLLVYDFIRCGNEGSWVGDEYCNFYKPISSKVCSGVSTGWETSSLIWKQIIWMFWKSLVNPISVYHPTVEEQIWLLSQWSTVITCHARGIAIPGLTEIGAGLLVACLSTVTVLMCTFRSQISHPQKTKLIYPRGAVLKVRAQAWYFEIWRT